VNFERLISSTLPKMELLCLMIMFSSIMSAWGKEEMVVKAELGGTSEVDLARPAAEEQVLPASSNKTFVFPENPSIAKNQTTSGDFLVDIPLAQFFHTYSDTFHLLEGDLTEQSHLHPPFPGPQSPTRRRAHPLSPRTMAKVYADVNANMPRSYWDYDSVNISWGALENYEVVRKIG
jgi:hypothetical protein